MGILLCEQNFRGVWIRNKSVRAEIGHILRTNTHTHAAKLVVEIYIYINIYIYIFLFVTVYNSCVISVNNYFTGLGYRGEIINV